VKRFNLESLDFAALASILETGGVVLMPTDTIYGLHGLAADAKVVARIAAMKGRDADKPFVVLGASPEQLEQLGCVIPDVLRSLWPAPLTAIVPLRTAVAASRGAETLAVRVPDLAWLRDLVAATGPLVSTSANRSGEPPVMEPDELARDLQELLDCLVDGGRREGKASAIVDFSGTEPRFIREGDPAFTQKLRKTLRKWL
jgi:tRNA threonylcarbamoyl adenosine modification protein (Sua5/YciO/YrdC/YwlC family)